MAMPAMLEAQAVRPECARCCSMQRCSGKNVRDYRSTSWPQAVGASATEWGAPDVLHAVWLLCVWHGSEVGIAMLVRAPRHQTAIPPRPTTCWQAPVVWQIPQCAVARGLPTSACRAGARASSVYTLHRPEPQRRRARGVVLFRWRVSGHPSTPNGLSHRFVRATRERERELDK